LKIKLQFYNYWRCSRRGFLTFSLFELGGGWTKREKYLVLVILNFEFLIHFIDVKVRKTIEED